MRRQWIRSVRVDANGPHHVVLHESTDQSWDRVQVGDVVFTYDDDPSLAAGCLVRVTGIRPGKGDPTARCLDVEPMDLTAALQLLANYEQQPTKSACLQTRVVTVRP